MDSNMKNISLNRINLIRSQITSNKCMNARKPTPISDDDVVIVSYCRTALGKAGKGSFKDTMPEILTSHVIKELLNRGNLKGDKVQEIVFGNVLASGANFMSARMSQFLAGLPEEVSLMTVNRLCSSGLQAVMNVAYSIASKQIDIGIGGGVESMSIFDMNNLVDGEKVAEEVFNTPKASNCMIPMGITSENVAEQFKVDRISQDKIACDSHRKASIAQKNGWFKDEIVPVKTTIKDKEGNLKEITVDQDEGIREKTTMQSLGKLKASFKQGGTTTAGNSSQVTDGAAGVLLARRSVAKQLGLPIVGRILGYAVAGVPPEIMGIGPAFAIPEVLKNVGMTMDDIDIVELNEAFASQASYCINKLNIPMEKINPRGGAIALGHPLGCTGARQFSTLLSELRRTNKKRGMISMCIGTGMGAACVLERE
jgi:acetyl-CoA acyltransferase 1